MKSSTAIERRGLIALAVILVVSVGAIAVWRGDTDKYSPVEAPDSARIALINEAARLDSITAAKASSPDSVRSSAKKKSSKKKSIQSDSYTSPLDYPIPQRSNSK